MPLARVVVAEAGSGATKGTRATTIEAAEMTTNLLPLRWPLKEGRSPDGSTSFELELVLMSARFPCALATLPVPAPSVPHFS